MNRRRLLAVTLGTAAAAATVGAVGISQAATDDPPGDQQVPPSDESIKEPTGGAGIYEDDPDQAGVSQDPNVSVVGDVEALPEDTEF
jgi:hypothetical protein